MLQPSNPQTLQLFQKTISIFLKRITFGYFTGIPSQPSHPHIINLSSPTPLHNPHITTTTSQHHHITTIATSPPQHHHHNIITTTSPPQHHHHNITTSPPSPHHHHNITTSPPQHHHITTIATSPPLHHHHNITTSPPPPHHHPHITITISPPPHHHIIITLSNHFIITLFLSYRRHPSPPRQHLTTTSNTSRHRQSIFPQRTRGVQPRHALVLVT